MSAALQEVRRMPRRPRKLAPRTPSGAISRAKGAGLADLAGNLQRLRLAIRKLAGDPFLESPFGVMVLLGEISTEQAAAARLFSEAREALDRLLGLPPRSPRAQDLSAVHGHESGLSDEETTRRVRQAQARFYAAQDSVGVGSAELRAIEEIVIRGAQPDGAESREALRRGLTRLVAHYRIAP